MFYFFGIICLIFLGDAFLYQKGDKVEAVCFLIIGFYYLLLFLGSLTKRWEIKKQKKSSKMIIEKIDNVLKELKKYNYKEEVKIAEKKLDEL